MDINNLNSENLENCNNNSLYDSFELFESLAKNITKIVLFGHTDVSDDIFTIIETPSYFEINSNKENNHYEIFNERAVQLMCQQKRLYIWLEHYP